MRHHPIYILKISREKLLVQSTSQFDTPYNHKMTNYQIYKQFPGNLGFNHHT